MKIKGLSINESEFRLDNGKMGKIAVFIYYGEFDPERMLDAAVKEYTKDSEKNTYVLMSENMDNPWMRVLVSEINDMFQEEFDTNKHHVDRMFIETIREEKLKILEQ
jgi:hypothetical protein